MSNALMHTFFHYYYYGICGQKSIITRFIALIQLFWNLLLFFLSIGRHWWFIHGIYNSCTIFQAEIMIRGLLKWNLFFEMELRNVHYIRFTIWLKAYLFACHEYYKSFDSFNYLNSSVDFMHFKPKKNQPNSLIQIENWF